MAVIDDLLNTIKEIKAFQNEYTNLPAALASVLRWKHIELMDELQRLRAFQENREHVSFLPSPIVEETSWCVNIASQNYLKLPIFQQEDAFYQ